MFRFIQALLGVTVVALVLAAGASPRAMADASTPPILLTPTAGQSFVGGTPIVFQIQTFPADSLLWLHVSRSPSLVDGCTIGSDEEIESFSSTANPSIYQAAPMHFEGDWMDTPGTYYWQAYRIHSGCVASAVRSLTITPGPILTGPTLLSPSPSQSFRAGTSLTFRIRTFSGDEYLWLQISKSQTRDACGIIGDDVDTESFVATSDPAVYEARSDGSWTSTPGTYYWQAYRIHYGAGADGCIESEVRSFTITRPPVRPPKKLSAARLQGAFTVKLTVRSSYGIGNVGRGQSFLQRWTFRPRCAKGVCSTRVSASPLSGALGRWSMLLRRSGAVYRESGRVTMLRCSSTPVRGPLSVSVKVIKGAWVDSAWRAKRIKGTFRHSVGSTRSGIYRCRAGAISATFLGTPG